MATIEQERLDISPPQAGQTEPGSTQKPPETRTNINIRLWQTPDFRNHQITRRHSDQFREKMSLLHGEVYFWAKRLVDRGIYDSETISKMVPKPFSSRNISDLKTRLRRTGRLAKPTDEETRLAKRIAHLGKPKSGSRQYSAEQENSFSLVKKLIESDLISKDLSNWRRLNYFSKRSGFNLSSLPDAEKLILEAYFATCAQKKRSKNALYNSFQQLGEAVDTVWFQNLTQKYQIITNTLLEKEETRRQRIKESVESPQALNESEILKRATSDYLNAVANTLENLLDNGQVPRHDTMGLKKFAELGLNIPAVVAQTVIQNHYTFQKWRTGQSVSRDVDHEPTFSQFLEYITQNRKLLEQIHDPKKRNLHHLNSAIRRRQNELADARIKPPKRLSRNS